MITHPDKVLFPADGITKGELAAYYESVAPLMLPHIAGRPVTMERAPAGIGEKGFMHKSVTRGFPDWLERVEVPKKKGTVHHPLVNDLRSLLWIANQNCITPHVWTSRVPDLFHPDVCVFDLDPSREDDGALRDAALRVRALLGDLGLDCRDPVRHVADGEGSRPDRAGLDLLPRAGRRDRSARTGADGVRRGKRRAVAVSPDVDEDAAAAVGLGELVGQHVGCVRNQAV